MSFRGQTYRIPCNAGGLNTNNNVENIPPESFVSGSKNINLHNGGRETRGGTAHYNSAAVTGTPGINGGYDYYKVSSSTRYLVAGTSDGKIITVDTAGLAATLKTTLQADKYYQFSEMNNKLYVTNGFNTVQTWAAGASTADLVAPAADWSAGVQPKQLIKHGYGNSERLWGFAVDGKEGFVYYSVDNNGVAEANFSGAGSGQLYIDTADGYGIVGAVEWQDRLIAFGKNRAYVINDTDASTANWGYYQAGWNGGVDNWRLIAKTDNDLFCMMSDGEIYSVTAVQSYGDYKRASITRPAYIHRWIQDNVNFSRMGQFHMIYDPEIRAIRVFVVRSGKTTVDTCLVYFIDRPADQAWSVHDNTSNVSGYSSASSFEFTDSNSGRKIYTGDYSGFVWKLEQATKADNSLAYWSGFKTARLDLGDKRVTKKFQKIYVTSQAAGAYQYSLRTWVDGSLGADSKTFSTSSSGGTLGTFVLGTDVLGGDQTSFSEGNITCGRVGKRLEIEIYNNTANKGFYISDILVNFIPLSNRVN